MKLSAVINYSVKQKIRQPFSYTLGLLGGARGGTSVLRVLKIASKAEANANKQFWKYYEWFKHSLDYCYYCVKSQQSNGQASL